MNIGPDSGKIYRLSKGYRILLTTILLPMVPFFIYFTIAWFPTTATDDFWVGLFIWALFPVLAVAGFYYLIWVHKWMAVVLPDSIQIFDVIKCKQIYFSDILGIRILNTQYASTMEFVTTLARPKYIRVWLGLDEADSFYRWAKSSFVDLGDIDRQKTQREVERFLQDDERGTKDEKLEKLKKAKTFAWGMYVISFIVGVWVIFETIFSLPLGNTSTLITIFLIMAVTLSMRHYSGIISLAEEYFPLFPVTTPLMILLPAVLVLRAFLEIRILDWQSVILPLLAISFIMFAVLFWCDVGVRKHKSVMFVAAVIAIMVGFGVTITQNEALDKSQPVVHQSVVREILPARQLAVSPWGPFDDRNVVNVSGGVYRQVRPSTIVNIYVYSGAFGIPWYTVEITAR
jgi:hypothetical protein